MPTLIKFAGGDDSIVVVEDFGTVNSRLHEATEGVPGGVFTDTQGVAVSVFSANVLYIKSA